MGSGQIWLPTNHNLLHALAGCLHLRPGLFTDFGGALCWPDLLRHRFWRIPGELSLQSVQNIRSLEWQLTCGLSKTLTTSYACEVVPTVLRPYVTAYVCMCWGAGILLSSGTVRATLTIDGDWAWRLPFCLQWIWPIPIALGAYLAPESPWNSVRRGKMDEARKSLIRLRQKGPDAEAEVEASLAYIIHTTNLEMAETEGGRFIDCFRGTNLRRTEIVSFISTYQDIVTNRS